MGSCPCNKYEIAKKVDMSDGERTVQTWRPNPLPSANKGSNVKSSYINRHYRPTKRKDRFFVFGLLTDGECPNGPNIWTHATHMQHIFSSSKWWTRLPVHPETRYVWSHSCLHITGTQFFLREQRWVAGFIRWCPFGIPSSFGQWCHCQRKIHDKAVRHCLFSNLTEAMESTQRRTPVPNALFLLPNRMNHIGRTAPHFLSTPLAGRIAVGLPAYPPPTKICGNRWSKCRGSYWKLCLIMFL